MPLEEVNVTPEKQKQKLAGQSAIAQKIFQCVPIEQSWTVHQVAVELRRMTGSSQDTRTLYGCLATLAEAGLVRCLQGEYRRVPVSAAAPVKRKEDKPMPEKKVPAAAPGSASALDVLGNLSQRLRSLADDLDAAALAFAEGSQEMVAMAERYKQLQALLRTPH